MSQQIKFMPLYDKYLISTHELGRGGLAHVYLGYDSVQISQVAIKISRQTTKEDRFVQMLAKYESSALTKLIGYPSIIQLFDTFELQGKQYLVTELCPKGTLRQHLKDRKFDQGEIVSYLKQIIDGYQNIYRNGIVHRDLKPSNILMTEDGKLKISDFGFAIFKEDLETQGKFSVGSTYYRAPETVFKYQYSSKSDVWAIGVILFEMVTQKLPWYHSDKSEYIKKILKEPIQNLLPTSINQDLATIIRRCLTISVQERATPEQLFRLACQIDLTSPIKKVSRISKINPTNNDNISSYLLNHVDFCRLQYQLLKMSKNCGISNKKWAKELENLLIFSIDRHFKAVENVSFQKFSQKEVQHYKKSEDYKKIVQIVENYRENYYFFRSGNIVSAPKNLSCLKKVLNWLSENVNSCSSYHTFLLYDYIITLSWLFERELEKMSENLQKIEMKEIVKSLRKELKKEGQKIIGSHLRILRERALELLSQQTY